MRVEVGKQGFGQPRGQSLTLIGRAELVKGPSRLCTVVRGVASLRLAPCVTSYGEHRNHCGGRWCNSGLRSSVIISVRIGAVGERDKMMMF